MFCPPARRSYIRGKRHFIECAAVISKALRVIMVARYEPFMDESVDQLAVFHARQVEAA